MWKIVAMTIDGSDSLFALWGEKDHNSPAGKRTRDLLIKLQVLYQLSYQGIHAPLIPTRRSQSSDHISVMHRLPLTAGDLDLWFEGLPPCIKVHLDCLAIYVKDCRNDNRWLWQSVCPVRWGEKDHNSPAGKRTRDLLIKLQVLYQLSYQGKPKV